MRIEFRPQSLTKNLVSEVLLNDGKTLNRIIETTGKKPKIIQLTYKKSELLPTQWFVESYNVMKRKGDGRVTKSFQVSQTQNNKDILIQNFYNKAMQKININIENGVVKKSQIFQNI